mmetsp:Transcript_12828/g.16847  ORF Transcript_12828/g.16847 Transcript_12828/m.16847 type:complete len:269 (+) Transcript_12828:106-912(+)
MNSYQLASEKNIGFNRLSDAHLLTFIKQIIKHFELEWEMLVVLSQVCNKMMRTAFIIAKSIDSDHTQNRMEKLLDHFKIKTSKGKNDTNISCIVETGSFAANLARGLMNARDMKESIEHTTHVEKVHLNLAKLKDFIRKEDGNHCHTEEIEMVKHIPYWILRRGDGAISCSKSESESGFLLFLTVSNGNTDIQIQHCFPARLEGKPSTKRIKTGQNLKRNTVDKLDSLFIAVFRQQEELYKEKEVLCGDFIYDDAGFHSGDSDRFFLY